MPIHKYKLCWRFTLRFLGVSSNYFRLPAYVRTYVCWLSIGLFLARYVFIHSYAILFLSLFVGVVTTYPFYGVCIWTFSFFLIFNKFPHFDVFFLLLHDVDNIFFVSTCSLRKLIMIEEDIKLIRMQKRQEGWEKLFVDFVALIYSFARLKVRH